MSYTTLVIGATGAMGRPIIHRLLGDDPTSQIRIFTRDPNSPFARQLVEVGKGRIKALHGNTSDRPSLDQAMTDVDRVFCNTDFWSSRSVETEYQQGVNVLEAAQTAGVRAFVYSSLDACAHMSDGRLPVPHYDGKAAVEAFVDRKRSDEFMRRASGFYSTAVSVLVTQPYYENFQNFFLPEKGELQDGRRGMIFRMAMGNRPFPMVALDDIAHFALMLLGDPATWGGRTLRIVSESLTLSEVAAIFERVTGIPAEYRPLDLAALEASSAVGHDMANSMRSLQEFGSSRDIERLRKLHPGLLSFEAWLRKARWRGEPRTVQKGATTGEAA